MHFHLPKPLHGWRAFAGEVGIIVLGVLIALGAEQVVQWVHSKHQQRETLERLFEEARIDVAQLRQRRPDAPVMQREIDFATELTKGKSCPPADEWQAVGTLGMYPQTTVRTSVYDEVIGAGGLAEIGSTRARDAVASFHSLLSWVQGQTDFFRSVQTTPLQVDDPRQTIIYDPSANEPEVTTFDRAALCADPRFRSRIADATRNHVVWDGFRERLTQGAIEMCGVLGHELGKECTPSEGPPFTDSERRIAAIDR